MYRVSAVFIGILIAIMVSFNGVLSNYTDQYVSILIIHMVGLIVVVTVLIIKKEKNNWILYNSIRFSYNDNILNKRG